MFYAICISFLAAAAFLAGVGSGIYLERYRPAWANRLVSWWHKLID